MKELFTDFFDLFWRVLVMMSICAIVIIGGIWTLGIENVTMDVIIVVIKIVLLISIGVGVIGAVFVKINN